MLILRFCAHLALAAMAAMMTLFLLVVLQIVSARANQSIQSCCNTEWIQRYGQNGSSAGTSNVQL